jgi:hypothetical protein
MSTEIIQLTVTALTQAINNAVEDKMRAVEKRVEKLELAHTLEPDGTVTHTSNDFNVVERIVALEQFQSEHEAIDHEPLENLDDAVYDKIRDVIRNDVTINIDL